MAVPALGGLALQREPGMSLFGFWLESAAIRAGPGRTAQAQVRGSSQCSVSRASLIGACVHQFAHYHACRTPDLSLLRASDLQVTDAHEAPS
ncbi:hypothetical protein GCM10010339_92460 [Streptomyces alanosinicus]|uniref:Uncharacterized protein n=1 Tax=Streptomyces alanosinicus TaxID=68171 RepID=A0A918YTF2_9ACTN|nr:hypothetical protein GCM10010339_92460 [Streptomyces alanosinicus]